MGKLQKNNSDKKIKAEGEQCKFHYISITGYREINA